MPRHIFAFELVVSAMAAKRRIFSCLCVLLVFALHANLNTAFADNASNADSQPSASIWSPNNLIAWEIAPCDVAKRSSEQRAQMLARLGFRYYAYIASTVPWNLKNDINVSQHDVDGEIQAMQRHGIRVLAWYLWINNDDPAEDPSVKSTLAVFRRYHIHPDIWIAQSFAYYPKSVNEWARLMPRQYAKWAWPNVSGCLDGFSALGESDSRAATSAYGRAITQLELGNFPKTRRAARERIEAEALRIGKLAKIAAAYGCRVDIYNHHGWFGVVDNELAIVRQLKRMGVMDVGLVYNFAHSRDALHDDAKDFPRLWARMRSHVVAINVAGLSGFDDVVIPSKGDRELAMMRVIKASGWKGPVGVIGALGPGDAEINLEENVAGLKLMASELTRAGLDNSRR
jgi:hypothetical protein